MNIINKLTIRHLKENKKRTLVTIIGVIISVAMVTAVATLGVSFLNLLIRQTISTDGEWHVQYKNASPNQIEQIEKDEATKELVISRNRGYARLEDSQNENKPYLFIKDFNKQGFENFPISLREGRIPTKENEVLLSEEIAKNAKVEYKIGDQISLEIGSRHYIKGDSKELTQNESLQWDGDKVNETITNEQHDTFTIVGIIERPNWEPTWSPGYTVIGYVDKGLLGDTDQADAIVMVKKIKTSLFQHSESLAHHLGIEKVYFNDNLLRFYGVTDNDNLRTTLFGLAAIIMGVIIIGSIALIYNAFAISVSERARHLGMLSSVGATKKQKRNSVFFEGFVIGTISIPIGIVSGLVGIGVTFWVINSFLEDALGTSEKLKLIVTPVSILISCVISITTIFISTYLPARKASQITAIDAIRQTQDVKLTGKTVKTSRLIRKLFGFEAEIGLKNLKRNKRRYQATVFSLIISIVLFLSVSFFTTNLKKSLVLSQDNFNFDIQVYSGKAENAEVFKSFSNLQNVTHNSVVKRITLTTWLDESMISKELKENLAQDRSILKDGKYPYMVILHGLDQESFADYAKKVGVDWGAIKDSKIPSAIVIDQISYDDYENNKVIETKSIHTKPGQDIDLFSLDTENGKEEFFSKIKIGALTEKIPVGEYQGGPARLDMIVPEETMDSIMTKKLYNQIQSMAYLNSSDPMKTQEALEDVKTTDMHIYNIYQSRQQEQQIVMLMSIFTYGFIVLITFISMANIFNTISTSISLRKREFAMLKSVGMTPKSFQKMIHYESIFYGLKALLYGIPISIGVMALIYRALINTFDYGFTLPWLSIFYVILAIFIIVGSAMIYSMSKVKKENIIDVLKQESI